MDDYADGSIIKVRFSPQLGGVHAQNDGDARLGEPTSELQLQLQVIRSFPPFEHVVVCHVRLIGSDVEDNLAQYNPRPSDGSSGFIVKLFDKRYTPKLHNSEVALDHFRAALALQNLGKDSRPPRSIPSRPKWFSKPVRTSLDDATLDQRTSERCATEYQIHKRYKLVDRIKDRPDTPHMYGCLELESDVGIIKGLLMEYIIPSLRFFDYLHQAGTCGLLSTRVGELCDQVIILIRNMSRHGIRTHWFDTGDILLQLSGDIRKEDILTHHASIDIIRLVLVGFKDARLLPRDKTDSQWVQPAKYYEDVRVDLCIRCALARAAEKGCALHGSSCWTGQTRWALANRPSIKAQPEPSETAPTPAA